MLVFGNNAGEKLTYVDSTLARVDKTLDSLIGINTFFISATDITVGGASGGPVVNRNGEAVAMTCAGVIATNSSYYLPLERAVRALKLYQKGEPITRGSLQVGFSHKTYEELQRMGMKMKHVARARSRFPESDGMLVVHRILAGGPGQKAGMQSGDILQMINGNLIHNYVQLLDELDNQVDSEVEICVLRDGEPITLKAKIQNLYEINPCEFIEVSDAIVHSLEYRVALHRNVPVKGVFLAAHGYMFQHLKSRNDTPYIVITALGNHEVADLDSFEKAIASYADGTEVSMRYFSLFDKSRNCVRNVTIDKHWHPFLRARYVLMDYIPFVLINSPGGMMKPANGITGSV